MDDLGIRKYTGDGKCRYKPLPGAWQEPEPYIASKALADAVNTALYLRRPLLLEGDPGCGKTRLAYAVAYELGYPLYSCYIRSTSRAQDLLYDYDAIGRLYDIQERQTAGNPSQPLYRRNYVTLGELGEAIKQSQNDIPSVLLIDEIDKADRDFSNDLLLGLERLQFQVKEVINVRFDALKGKTKEERRDFLPLIIITSNREKELPKPFLRRCLFYYLKFPENATLTQIIQSHFKTDITRVSEAAIQKFGELRGLRSWQKIPGTSEFLDWLRILERDQQGNQSTAEALADTPTANLPHLETLVKTQQDHEALSRTRIPD
ncbi:ATPase [Moorena producens PAL-8-15-08-1]|uniref:ATPase n=1 Tax=Moorena producens PAL-8-15-08-1 TaxID=1458985 RepID=A0A1D8TPD5_9CYAN|nr:MoxR family ATPase [Moorena producens]AOW99528.1 ATPase [Moorena producens PAL-8-15-08-1]